MSSKPETRFYTAVNRLVPRSVHREKMHNPYRGGTADVWYSGSADDLWAEYKWLATVPKTAEIQVSHLMSPLQLQWLKERYEEGRNVVVILGSPEGAWIFERRTWEGTLHPAQLRDEGLSKQNVADYIRRRTMIA